MVAVGDLYSRLKRIKSGRAAGAAAPGRVAGGVVSTGSGLDCLGLEDWHEVAPLVFERETREALPPDVARGLRSEENPALLGSRLLGRALPPESLVFMDTETTGLSGGAGTTVFLVGGGWIDGGAVRVRQVLLSDFPAEPDFLERVASLLRASVWVSYNGRAFDAKLLEARFLMNGLPPLSSEQLDLLHWARRLWRRALGSCSLSSIEASVLDRGRADDIPGVEIPERYFRFLRHRDARELHGVFEHHRLDIVSLVHLFARIESVLRDPLGASSGSGAQEVDAPGLDAPEVDAYQLGRWLLLSDEENAVRLLERAARSDDLAYAERAGLLLARFHRRHRRAARALEALAPLLSAARLPVVEQAAKIHEHDLRDPRAAYLVVEEYLRACPDAAGHPALAHRLERLRRKRSAPTSGATAGKAGDGRA
jgi:uncharacterized protein